MPAANVESAAAYNSIHSPLASPGGSMPPGQHSRSCLGACGAFMWRLLNCFRNTEQEQQQIRARPVVVPPPVGNQYQAPIVTPSPQASGGSVSSCDEDLAEQGTLLPKRRTPQPGWSGGAASSAAAAATEATTAAAAAAGTEAGDAAARDPPRHRRTGSDSSRTRIAGGGGEGVRARVVSAATAKAKFGTSEAEFGAVAELLGADGDDEDFCPTCLEVYTDDNPKIFTRCGHSFHMQCIYAWLERKSTCPLCERPMDLQDDILL